MHACIAFASDDIVSGASIICPLILKEYVMCVCVRERESGRVHSNGNCVKACDQTKWCVCRYMCVCVCGTTSREENMREFIVELMCM